MHNIHKEILDEAITSEDKKPSRLFTYIVGIFLLVILVSWAIPKDFIKADPNPKNIPGLEIVDDNNDFDRPNSTYIAAFVKPDDVKILSTKVVTESCEMDKENYRVCHAKALFYFVRNNFQYVGETDDYFQTPKEFLYTRGGDCDDFAIMLASMLKSSGIPARLILTHNHAYVQGYIDGAPSKYKEDDGWINMDPTCRNCLFGSSKDDERKRVLWV